MYQLCQTVIMSVSNTSENVMLTTVSTLRRLLRKALFVTKRVRVMLVQTPGRATSTDTTTLREDTNPVEERFQNNAPDASLQPAPDAIEAPRLPRSLETGDTVYCIIVLWWTIYLDASR